MHNFIRLQDWWVVLLSLGGIMIGAQGIVSKNKLSIILGITGLIITTAIVYKVYGLRRALLHVLLMILLSALGAIIYKKYLKTSS